MSEAKEPATHRPGCSALGGYGHGVGPCDCECTPAPEAASVVEPVAYINGDDLDNLLDDREATVQGVRSNWFKTPLYRGPHPLSEERIREIIGKHLTSAYACTRVWEAWGVCTMSEDDFVPLGETEFVDDLTAALLAAGISPSSGGHHG